MVIPKDKVYKGEFDAPKNSRGRGPLGFRAIRNIYDSSETRLRINSISKDHLFYLTQLAMWTYNFKEDTKFDNVKVLRGSYLLLLMHIIISLFKPFLLKGLPLHSKQNLIIPDDSDFDDFSDNSKKYRPSVGHPKDSVYRRRLYQLIETNDPQFKLPVYLSQFALINYSIDDLHLHAARHDISSLKIVKPMERVSKQQTTYLLTFEASLCADSNKVETFETEIYIPNFFPTTTIEFWDFAIKTN